MLGVFEEEKKSAPRAFRTVDNAEEGSSIDAPGESARASTPYGSSSVSLPRLDEAPSFPKLPEELEERLFKEKLQVEMKEKAKELDDEVSALIADLSARFGARRISSVRFRVLNRLAGNFYKNFLKVVENGGMVGGDYNRARHQIELTRALRSGREAFASRNWAQMAELQIVVP